MRAGQRDTESNMQGPFYLVHAIVSEPCLFMRQLGVEHRRYDIEIDHGVLRHAIEGRELHFRIQSSDRGRQRRDSDTISDVQTRIP